MLTGYGITSLTVEPPSLESLFLRLYNGDADGEARPMTLALTGTAPLLRTTVRFDGRLYAPWIVLATVLSASSVLVYPWVFPTEADRAGLAAAIGSNPALGLIFGPARDLSTVDGFNAWRSLALGGFFAALGAIFAVTRATRGQEDSGQAELLASGVLGRGSRLMTATAMGLIGSLLLGLIASLVDDPARRGSVRLPAASARRSPRPGGCSPAVAAVTAQLGSDARAANSMAVGTLGALFILRGFAYSIEAPAWTIWINPLGWLTETQPATGRSLVAAAAGRRPHRRPARLAFALQARRDFGLGAVAPRPGPARGSVRSTWRLALRINRGPLIAWAFAFVGPGAGVRTVRHVGQGHPRRQQRRQADPRRGRDHPRRRCWARSS